MGGLKKVNNPYEAAFFGVTSTLLLLIGLLCAHAVTLDAPWFVALFFGVLVVPPLFAGVFDCALRACYQLEGNETVRPVTAFSVISTAAVWIYWGALWFYNG